MNVGEPTTIDEKWEYADGLRFLSTDDPEFEERSVGLYTVLLPLVSRGHDCFAPHDCPDCQDVWHESFIDCIQNRSLCRVNFRAFCRWRVRNSWKQHRTKTRKENSLDEISEDNDGPHPAAVLSEQDWLETVMSSVADRNLEEIDAFNRALLGHAKAHGAIDERKWQVVWLHTLEGKSHVEIAESIPGVNTAGNARVLTHRGWDEVTKHFMTQPFLLGWYSNIALRNAPRFLHNLHSIAEDSVRVLVSFLQQNDGPAGIEGPDNMPTRKMLRLGFLWLTSWLADELPSGDKVWERVRWEFHLN